MYEQDLTQQKYSKQKNFPKLLQLYYNSNIMNLSSLLKRCIPDIDSQFENKYLRKNDKLWVQANLLKIYQANADQLQKSYLQKNATQKNSIQKYYLQFQSLKSEIKTKITQQQSCKKDNNIKVIKQRRKLFFTCNKNEQFRIQNITSEPSQNLKQRKSLTSKRPFRVRQFPNNLHEIINNTRYMEKLQRVKLQSTFTQFFFKKQLNPQIEKIKTIDLQRKCIDKLKTMTNIRCNFNLSQKFIKQSLSHNSTYQQNQLTKTNNFLGFQTLKRSFYKPKSKCNNRNKKLFVNF